jgi:hypothetical protein
MCQYGKVKYRKVLTWFLGEWYMTAKEFQKVPEGNSLPLKTWNERMHENQSTESGPTIPTITGL